MLVFKQHHYVLIFIVKYSKNNPMRMLRCRFCILERNNILQGNKQLLSLLQEVETVLESGVGDSSDGPQRKTSSMSITDCEEAR